MPGAGAVLLVVQLRVVWPHNWSVRLRAHARRSGFTLPRFLASTSDTRVLRVHTAAPELAIEEGLHARDHGIGGGAAA